jgi:phosphotransferase system  glucose/maltose/N-acetylglucosamine-specific IIC component
MRCAAHGDVETNLACGKCGTPICPKCLVETPVGARCRKCANVRRLPTYNITPVQYVKAVAAGLVMAIAVGIAWAWLRSEVGVLGWSLTLGLILGSAVAYAIAEIVSRAINQKRGRPLQAIACTCFVLCYAVSWVGLSGQTLTFFLHFDLIDILIVILGVVVAAARLR